MKIDHLAIWSDDIELLKRFYTKYFGFVSGEMYYNPKRNFSSYFLSQEESSARIELMNIPGMMNRTDKDDVFGLAHFAMSVGSRQKVDELTKQLRNDGYTILSEPRTTGDGCYESAVADPEGNRVEITE